MNSLEKHIAETPLEDRILANLSALKAFADVKRTNSSGYTSQSICRHLNKINGYLELMEEEDRKALLALLLVVEGLPIEEGIAQTKFIAVSDSKGTQIRISRRSDRGDGLLFYNPVD